MPFRQFKIGFLVWKLIYSYLNFAEVCYQLWLNSSKHMYASIGLDVLNNVLFTANILWNLYKLYQRLCMTIRHQWACHWREPRYNFSVWLTLPSGTHCTYRIWAHIPNHIDTNLNISPSLILMITPGRIILHIQLSGYMGNSNFSVFYFSYLKSESHFYKICVTSLRTFVKLSQENYPSLYISPYEISACSSWLLFRFLFLTID